jgi:hypothetical protein
MPRLTDHGYLEIQHWLGQIWRDHPQIFSLMSPAEQRRVHDYFMPSQEVTLEELLAHRQRVSTEQPSLPQCAGRALRKLREAIEAQPAPASALVPTSKRQVVVRAVARPTIDGNVISRALLRAAEDLGRVDHDSAA